nr:ferritin heavy chain-like [Kogia breviceps]
MPRGTDPSPQLAKWTRTTSAHRGIRASTTRAHARGRAPPRRQPRLIEGGQTVQYGPLTTECPAGHKPAKSVRDHLFGNPAKGDDSPKGATSTPAALTKYSGYKSRLVKLAGIQLSATGLGALRLRPPSSPTLGILRGHHRRLRLRRARFRTAFTLALTPAMLPALPAMLPAPPAMLPAMLPAPPSQVRHNYHPDCEASVSTHFTLELHASFKCLDAAFYLHRDDVALKHFTGFCLRRSHEHSGRAQGLMRLQNQRGAASTSINIRKPVSDEWKSGLKAMKCALFLEKRGNRSLLHLHQLATDKSDPHPHHFLATHYLSQQVAFIRELEAHVTTLSMMGAPDVDLVGRLVDKLSLDDSDKKN